MIALKTRLRGILAIAEQKIRRAWLSLSPSFLQLRNASDAELAVATMATLVMAAPMSLFMMLSLLSSQFPQAWPCKLPFLNNSPISCFNQGCGQFSCSGKHDFNFFHFLPLAMFDQQAWRRAWAPSPASYSSSHPFQSFSCHPDTYYLSLSKAMRGRSALEPGQTS